MAAWVAAHRIVLGLLLLGLTGIGGAAGLLGWGIGGPPSGAVLVVAGDATPAAPGAAPTATAAPGVPAPTATAAAALVTVYASGAVQHPGVYTLPTSARVAELLQLAGGPAPDADLDQVNLALRLHDEEQIFFPHRGTPVAVPVPAGPAPPAQSAGSATAPPAVVNLNSAPAAALETLPGIGPALAGRIVEYRTAHGRFTRIEQIQDVPGIGPKLFDRVRAYLTVDP
jgi:competence protein ComEA